MNKNEASFSLLVNEEIVIREVLKALDRTGFRIVFAADNRGRLVGSISDGDVRRGLLRGIGLDQRACTIMNRGFISLPDDMAEEHARIYLTDRISVIPLVDPEGVATRFLFQRDPGYIPASEPMLDGNELVYVIDCVKSGWISSQGTYVRGFEEAFARYVGVPPEQAVSVSNGTVALQLALAALGVGPGDEVIVPDLTFAATLNAVLHVGASPVIIDVHPTDLTIQPTAVQAAITGRTRAIIPVHLYGQMCDMSALQTIASAHDIILIEDAAEALGSQIGPGHAGTFGDAGTYSFFANKLITTGEGGMVVFRSPAIADRARMLRDHGMDPKKRYWHLEAGYNFRLTNMQAAIGLAQLERITDLLGAKLELARTYAEHLADLSDILVLPNPVRGGVHSFWNFVVLLRDTGSHDTTERMIEFMRERHIDVRRVFYPMHLMPPYEHLRKLDDCPHSTSASKYGIAFPASPKLSKREVADICNTFRQGIDMLQVERLTGEMQA